MAHVLDDRLHVCVCVCVCVCVYVYGEVIDEEDRRISL